MTKKQEETKIEVARFFREIKSHSHLCSQCGGCIAICPVNALSLKKVKGGYEIKYDEDKCIGCKKCLEICPSREIGVKKMKNQKVAIGHFLSTYKGHSQNKSIRKNGASGGIAISLLKFGLENKLFDKVICLKSEEKYPFENRAVVIKKPADLLKSSGPKYRSYPIVSALKKIGKKEKVAITCLPCHAKAIKKMGLKNVFLVGLFCSGQINQDFIKYFLKKEGVNSFDVKKIQYRHGKWPGKLLIQQKKNKKLERNFNRSYLSAAYNSLIFTPTYCLLCDDFFGEKADISLGDPWKMEEYYRDYGNNLIITRTKKAEGIIKAMAAKKEIFIEKVKPEEIFFSQIDSVEKKKVGLYTRLKILKALRIKLPGSIKARQPISEVKLILSYPMELINVFNCFFIKKSNFFYRLIFNLPKSFIFFYRFSFLGLVRINQKIFGLK